MRTLERAALTMYYALITAGDHVPIWFSDPGGGKTRTQADVAAALGVAPSRNVQWALAHRTAEDLAGWPTPLADGLHFLPPWQIAQLALDPSSPAAIFLDEVGNAPRSTQAGALRVMDSRMFGEQRVTAFLSMATNPPESGTDHQEMAKAFANRGVWLPFPDPTADEHVEYMAARGRPPMEYRFPVRDPVAEERGYVKAVGIYAAFRRLNGYVLREDCNSEEVVARWPMAYCTPRSWETAVRLLGTCLAYDDTEPLAELVCGTIGHPVGHLFADYALKHDHVDPEAALADPTLCRFDPARPDRAFNELLTIVMAATSNHAEPAERLRRWNAGLRCTGEYIRQGISKPFCVVAAQGLSQGKKACPGPVDDDVRPVVEVLRPLVAAVTWEN